MTKPHQHRKYCPPRAWCQTNTCWEKEQNGRFLKNPVSINQGPSVCLGFGCLASGHKIHRCVMRRKTGSGQQQRLWEHFLSAASILAPMKRGVLWEETKAGLKPHCGVECILYPWVGVCCLSSPRSWLWEPGYPTPISEPSVFVSKCPPWSGDGPRPPSPPNSVTEWKENSKTPQ